MNDSRCKVCGKLVVGKESDDLGNPNRMVSREWTRAQLAVPRQVAKVTCPVSAFIRQWSAIIDFYFLKSEIVQATIQIMTAGTIR